jgi:large subunit ribosomal protein L3
VKALITRKIGMTSIINDNGAAIAVTLLSATPNTITQVKTQTQTAIQPYKSAPKSLKKLAKQQGHFKPAGVLPKIIREFRIK